MAALAARARTWGSSARSSACGKFFKPVARRARAGRVGFNLHNANQRGACMASRVKHRPRAASLAASSRGATGFTLVELMVSIALVLLLVLGINAVFTLSARTVGIGQQVSEIQRQFRNAE